MTRQDVNALASAGARAIGIALLLHVALVRLRLLAGAIPRGLARLAGALVPLQRVLVVARAVLVVAAQLRFGLGEALAAAAVLLATLFTRLVGLLVIGELAALLEVGLLL